MAAAASGDGALPPDLGTDDDDREILLVSDWVDEYEYSNGNNGNSMNSDGPNAAPSEEEKDNTNTRRRRRRPPSPPPPRPNRLSQFESVPPDVSSHILSYLPVLPDLLKSVALVSSRFRDMTRHDALWRNKFVSRWNVGDGGGGGGGSVLPDPVWTVRLPSSSLSSSSLSSARRRSRRDRDEAAVATGAAADDGDGDEQRLTIAPDGRHTAPRPFTRPAAQRLEVAPSSGSDGGGGGRTATTGRPTSSSSSTSSTLWYRSYRAAHRNPHDLWLTHWNCAMPVDGTSPGRCAVPDLAVEVMDDGGEVEEDDVENEAEDEGEAGGEAEEEDGVSRDGERNSRRRASGTGGHASNRHRLNPTAQCPTCRYHPLLNPTLAEAERALNSELAFAEGGEDPVVRTARAAASSRAVLVRDLGWHHDEHRDGGDGGDGSGNDSVAEIETTTKVNNDIATTTTVTPAEAIRASSMHSAAKWARRMRVVDGLDLTLRPRMRTRPKRARPKRTRSDATTASAVVSDSIRSAEAACLDWDCLEGDYEDEDEECKGCYKGACQDQNERDDDDGVVDDDAGRSSSSSSHAASNQALLQTMKDRRDASSEAFAAASTHRRTIDPNQYRTSGLNFMTDAVFFTVRPTYEKVRVGTGWVGSRACGGDGDGGVMTELEHALRDVYGDRAMSGHLPESDGEVRAATASGGSGDYGVLAPGGGGTEAATAAATAAYLLPNIASVEPNAPGTLSSLGPSHDTTSHTWHVARLSNPDYARPITFRTYVQRPDCFAVFPAEGYLGPGETCHITFSVRTFGSLIAEAFESIDVGREEVDPLLADVYAAEGNLPYAPFAIRYMYAPAMPCVPPGFLARTKPSSSAVAGDVGGGVLPPDARASSSSSSRPLRTAIGYLWDNVACETDVRTIYVSAHVNANYGFDEFEARTMVPFEFGVRAAAPASSSFRRQRPSLTLPLTFLSPNLELRDPDLFAKLNNMSLETEPSARGDAYRTEKGCITCGRGWGARSEELGRAYFLRRLVCDKHSRVRSRQMVNFVKCLRLLPRLLEHVPLRAGADVVGITEQMQAERHVDESIECLDDVKLLDRVLQLAYHLHCITLLNRANRSLSRLQRRQMANYEIVLNDMVVRIQNALIPRLCLGGGLSQETDESEESMLLQFLGNSQALQKSWKLITLVAPWRHAGVYKDVKCSDSLFNFRHDSEAGRKDEPDYLDGFRSLRHSPGFYGRCLGLQDDPNHIDELELTPETGTCMWRHADVYKENAYMAVACSLAMIHDPRSLLVYGVYDRSKSPGTVARGGILSECAFRIPASSQSKIAKSSEGIGQSRKPFRLNNAAKVASSSTQLQCYVRSTRLSLKKSSILGWKAVSVDINDADPEGGMIKTDFIVYQSSFMNYLLNIPPPGVGRFPVSALAMPSRVVPFHIQTSRDFEERMSRHHRISRNNIARSDPGRMHQGRGVAINDGQDARQPLDPAIDQNQDQGEEGGPRIINLLWLISAHLGWEVNDDRSPGAVLVERGILIATQWLSNTLMALPLLLTLLARYAMLISSSPIDYHLEGLPYTEKKRMRYLTSDECGYAAVVVILLYLVLGRFSERNVCRTYERAMMEQIPAMSSNSKGLLQKALLPLSLQCQRLWDSITPLFLQRLVFTPTWNRRSRRDVMNFIIQARSQDLREHRSSFSAANGRGGGQVLDTKNLKLNGTLQPNISFKMKLIIGLLVSLGSFCSGSPHFSLNLLTVFYSSIALGLSMSLQYMEIGHGSQLPGTRTIFKPMRLNVVIVAAFLVGQLVGSSGGVLFLAEFVVITVSLLLGGATTISTNAVESWMCFFFLSATAFSGYLFARVGLVDGTRNKRSGGPSLFLCLSLIGLGGLLIFAMLFWEWEIPPTAMVIRSLSSFEERKHGEDRSTKAVELQ